MLSSIVYTCMPTYYVYVCVYGVPFVPKVFTLLQPYADYKSTDLLNRLANLLNRLEDLLNRLADLLILRRIY